MKIFGAAKARQNRKIKKIKIAVNYGFNMENYGHDGRTNPDGLGIGPATHYDWGNGSAAEAYNRILDKFGIY